MAKRIRYIYAGHDLNELGIVVSASAGVIDTPERKERTAYDWDNMNGHIVDVDSRPQYKEREIKLSCTLRATSSSDFMIKIQQLQSLLDHKGLEQLLIYIPGLDKPLVFLVYPSKGLTITKQWREGTNIGTFEITLEEPEPMKRVFETGDTTAASINATLEKQGDVINVYWGDGQKTLDITANYDGDERTLTHTYNTRAHRFVIVTGDVEYATTSTTNMTEIWNLL